MKKLIALLLSLALMLGISFAIAEGITLPEFPELELPGEYLNQFGEANASFALVEDHFVVEASYNSYIGTYVAVLENTNQQPAMITRMTLRLMDKEGVLIKEQELYGAIPMLSAPGEALYLNNGYILLSEDERAKVATWTLEASGMLLPTDDMMPVTQLQVSKSAILESETYDFTSLDFDTMIPEYFLMATVDNPNEEAVFDLNGTFIVRDAAGKLIYISNVAIPGAGIPAKGQILIHSLLGASLASALREQGHLPVSLEVIAMSSPGY